MRFAFLGVMTFSLLQCICFGADGTDAVNPEQTKFFENEVRPLLAEKCWGCHGAEKQKGDLRLDSIDAILHGGESGASLVPGNADESLLIQAVRYESFEMPPSGPLTDKEIEVLSRWVKMGAPWPGTDPQRIVARPRELFSADDRNWWAFQPLKVPAIPKDVAAAEKAQRWPRNTIDLWILDELKSAGLTPAAEADRTTLIRRLYFDLLGLPPTPEQVASFVNDSSSDAYERLVDELLESPAYGERAARLWLDLVRYADSDGYRADGYRPDAWQYRDYVIRSFNNDKPYDRFVQEQIAGDELFPDDVDAQIALGYLRHWVYEWNIRDAPGQWKTILEDVTDTTADVFMGLGLQCAKCHNHKYDPLLQKDYYRLQAFFAPLMPTTIDVATKEEKQKYETQLKEWELKTLEIRDQIATIEAPYRENLKNQAINRFPEEIQLIARKPEAERTPFEQQLAYLVSRQVEAEYDGLEGAMKAEDKERVLTLKRSLEAFSDARPKPLAKAMAVRDVGVIAPPTTIPKRTSELIEPGFPSVLGTEPANIPTGHLPSGTTGRRAELARWLTRPDNPLTPRVIVNRLWQMHFGRGLAANASDFGRLGDQPTHPELLDHLASELVRGGWKLKSLHRMIVNSATYRQSTEHPQSLEFQQIDPQNRLYWRGDTRRLQAEQIRDAMLAVSGSLVATRGGPGVNPDVARRTIYTRVMRNSPDELLDSFDLPLFFNSNSSRNTTTTPVQSLLLINSETMLAHARRLAKATQGDTASVADRVDDVWRRVYGRTPSEDDKQQSLQFIAMQTTQLSSDESNTASKSLIETAKLPYRDGQAVRFLSEDRELQLSIDHQKAFDVDDFTLEAFFQLRSIDQGAAVRTIAAKWNGDHKTAGWSFGVTGKGSRRKPQTLVMQLTGEDMTKSFGNRAIFSDQHVEINKPYYTAASVKLAREGMKGSITFFLKDLSNDDAPLLVAEIEHDIARNINNTLPMTFGGMRNRDQSFDGLVDDVRLISAAASVDQLLYTAEKSIPGTIGYWQFESDPGVMKNSVKDDLEIAASGRSIVRLEPSEAAFVDFCHALLNSNEFLYVH